MGKLVLGRRHGEGVQLTVGDIKIIVRSEGRRNMMNRISFEAPRDVEIVRLELLPDEETDDENQSQEPAE